MGYRLPGNEVKAAIEIYPVSGRKMTAAASGAGLADAAIPTILVEGDNTSVYRFGREPDGTPSDPWGWEDLDLSLLRNAGRSSRQHSG